MSNLPQEGAQGPIWGEVISVYSDSQALEDGTLDDLTQFPRVSFRGLPINRMTSHLFEALRPFIEAEMPLFKNSFGQALASLLRTKCTLAEGDPGNTGEIGDIYKNPTGNSPGGS